MAGTTIQIKDSELQKDLRGILGRFNDLRPAMKIIGSIVRASVDKNFEAEGRPRKWAPLAESTKKRRKDTPLLQVQGHHGGLRGSINYQSFDDRVVVGTNKVYAAVHQFGAQKGSFGTVLAQVPAHERKLPSGKMVEVKAHTRKITAPWGDIPARPFLMVQDEDWVEIKHELSDYLLIGK
jgi:phage virion morphogenesis protein